MSTDESRRGTTEMGALCQEYRRLLDEFGVAVRDILRLHEQQFQAIIQGDTECNRFDLLIHMANERKQKAKYEYIRHVEEHGCAKLDGTIYS
jgi:hypothetical protein